MKSPGRLEKAKDKNAEAAAIIKETYKKHNRVIFNGNNYDGCLGERS